MPIVIPSKGLGLLPVNARFKEPQTTHLSMSSLGSESQDVYTSYNRQQLYKKIHEWFIEWQPGQQRTLLCGLTNRCSTSQLESIATSLEPLFHRDFVTSLRKRYPSAPFRRQTNPVVNESKDVGTFALELAKEIIEGAMLACIALETKARTAIVESGNKMNEKLTENREAGIKALALDLRTDALGNVQSIRSPVCLAVPSVEATRNEKNRDNDSSRPVLKIVAEIKAENYAREPEDGHTLRTVNTARSISQSVEDAAPGKGLKKIRENVSDEWEDGVSSTVRGTGSSVAMIKYDGPRKIFISRQILTSFEYTLRPKLGRGLRPMMFQNNMGLLFKRQHASIVNRQHMRQSYPPTTSPVGVSIRVHRHRGSLNTAEGHSEDVFDTGKRTKLGPVKALLRTGSVRRPNQLTDLNAPKPRLYKHVKFWGPNQTDGKTFVRSKRSALNSDFIEQINGIWEWMAGCEEFEKLNFLVEVVKMCEGELLNYFTQCLLERLLERINITWLSDELLILIFSYLPEEDINTCSRVCRRWRYLAACNELWMIKSQEFGLDHGIPNILELVYGAGQREDSIDWRLAYEELQSITEQAQHSIPLPSRLAFENATPDGMKRVAGKFLPSSEPAGKFYNGGRRDSRFSGSSMLTKSLDCGQNDAMISQRSVFGREHAAGMSTIISDRSMSRDESGSSLASLRHKKHRDQLSNMSESLTGNSPRRQFRGRRKGSGDEDDVALDIRPELVQLKNLLSSAVDILPKQWSAEDAKETRERLQNFAAKAKPIRRVRKLQGHKDAVLSVEMDARRLITGSMDRSLRIWDIRSGRNIHKLIGHKGGVTCMVFDNDTVYTGSWDMAIMVWNLVTFKREAVVLGHTGSISCLAMNDDYLLSGSHDFTVRVWRRSTLLCDVLIKGHRSHVTCMVLQGPHVITGSSDRSIRISEFLTGLCVKVIKTSYPVSTLWMTGSLLLTGNQRGELHVINKETGQAEVAIQAHEAPITRVAFFSNHIFTSSADSTIKEWDLMSMVCIRLLQGHTGAVKDIKICSKCIVSAGADGHVRVWDKILPKLVSEDPQNELRIEIVDQTQKKH